MIMRIPRGEELPGKKHVYTSWMRHPVHQAGRDHLDFSFRHMLYTFCDGSLALRNRAWTSHGGMRKKMEMPPLSFEGRMDYQLLELASKLYRIATPLGESCELKSQNLQSYDRLL